MDTEIKKKWVTALRSGNYIKTTGRLHNKKMNSFCALGVLCDVLKIPYRVDERGRIEYKFGDTYSVCMIPDDFATDTLKLTPPFVWDIADMNDVGCSFSEIANTIETII